MEKETVKRFLTCDYPELIDLALSYARLPDKEREVIELCIFRDLTQEEAAEEIGYDVSTIRRRQDRAFKSLCAKFDHLTWIYKVI